MPDTTPASDRPAESILGPITPIHCPEPGCHWACHGVPDKYADSRARIVREHVAAEHAPALEPGTTTSEGPADEEQEPIQLRWGLDDVMHGDDDTTTVLLSGPGREPYWVELDPERTAALRDALPGPAAPPAPVDRAAILRDAAEVAATHQSDCQNCAVELEVAASLRRLAGEAAAGVQQPTKSEARTRIADALADADGWKWAPGFKNSSPSYQEYLRQADVALTALTTPLAAPAVPEEPTP